LQDMLTRLPAAGQLDEFLPDGWRAARQANTAIPPPPATDTRISSAESAS
jgi:hypothetical protein